MNGRNGKTAASRWSALPSRGLSFAVLAMAGCAGVGGDAGRGAQDLASDTDAGATSGLRRWSDPATWGGAVPTATTVANITAPVLLDVDAHVAGVTIQDGGELVFDPSVAHTLESTGNVVVLGKLTMHPATPAVVQTLRFVNVDESRFQGGGMVVLDTDVGLWVMEDGRLDLVGSPRTGWTRLAGGIAAGATSATLQTAPAGWQAGDEIVISPTEPPTVGDPAVQGFDGATIRTISGAALAWSTRTSRAHPQVNGTWTAEVMNLTRNVRIEGTPGHRTHVFVHAMQPQNVSYVQLRYVGPRQLDDEGYTDAVLGRYGLHFHMAEDGSRGSRIVGTVVRDAGAHAFVPHESHGIYFYDTVAYNTFDEAYWWDTSADTRTPGPETNDTVYDHCAAASIHTDPAFRGYQLTGFALLQGLRNVVRDSVAVGVEGNVDASGFEWPESDGEHGNGVWNFSRGNVTHNNAVDGIFAWQNDSGPHVIANFASYYNGAYGVDHGAYGNRYHYENAVLYGNAAGALDLQGISADTTRIRFDNVTFDGAGLSTDLVASLDHQFDGTTYPTIFTNDVFRGARNAFHFGGDAAQPDAIDVLFPTLSTTADVVFDAGAPAANVVRLQYDASRAVKITSAGRTTIAPFATSVDTSLPQVSVLSPTGGTQVAGSVAVTTQSYDNVGVVRVEFLVDGAVQATSTTAPFGFTLDATALSAGAHTLQLQAHDAAGNTNSSELVTVFAGL